MKKIYFLSVFFILLDVSILLSQESVKDSIKIKDINSVIIAEKCEKSDVIIDGDLSDSCWAGLKTYGDFVQIEPKENEKPSSVTEFKVFYDDDNIYFGITCYDDNPNAIRKTMTDRDKIFQDDWVGIILDTYGESQQGYELFVNPYGIQGDLMWTIGGNEDATFDAIWYSDAKIYNDRWTVEIAIPFKSLRFPDKYVQDWKIHFLRTKPRENREQMSFVRVSRDDPSLFTHYARIENIKGIKGGKNIEVLPYVLGYQNGQRTDLNNSNSEFKNNPLKGELGINVKYGITSNLTADFTYNPDFSQIESDAARIDVNSTFALFYNEKRPFFLEGSNIFTTPMRVVYTRSINNPLYALKLSGKIGNWELGLISGLDKKSPFIIPLEERSIYLPTEKESFGNLFRLKRNMGNESYLGFIITDREIIKDKNKPFGFDGYNRVAGLDGRFKFLGNYYLTFQLLRTMTREPNDTTLLNDPTTFDNGKHTVTFDGEYLNGYANSISINRSARHWNFTIDYSDVSPGVRGDLGFNSNVNYRTLSTYQGYTFYPETKILNRFEPSFFGYIRHDIDGRLKEEVLEPQINLNFAKQMYLYIGLLLVNNEEFGGIYHKGARRGHINFQSNTFKEFTGGFFISAGKSIVRVEDPSFVGWALNFAIWNTIKPVSNFVIENNYTYYELDRSYKGEKIFAGYILRTKTTYQISKSLSMRLVFQYDTFSKNFEIDPLISYKLNPFTIFYLGSTHNFSDLPELNGKTKYVEASRQIFLKLQYLWRI